MPDRIEVASSGRARCRACRRSIAKGEERYAEAVPNPVAEGESQHYYHLICAAERRPKPFATFLETLEPARADSQELLGAARLALAHHRLERLGVLERSKSARANCRHCREPIDKDGWRVALQPIEDGRLASWGFLHLACVGAYTGIKPSRERLLRYSELGADDVSTISELWSALPEREAHALAAEQAPSTDAPAAPDEEGEPDAPA
ncbi:MAG TPA: hypothetical protein VG963_20280 [Polyangiaceae bacterium]|nr:hypothetical protein [Polyangiaceae bacterium]